MWEVDQCHPAFMYTSVSSISPVASSQYRWVQAGAPQWSAASPVNASSDSQLPEAKPSSSSATPNQKFEGLSSNRSMVSSMASRVSASSQSSDATCSSWW